MTDEPRPFDEQFDTMMEVERNPTGAFLAIQAQAAELAHIKEDLAKIARRPHRREQITAALDFKIRCAEKALKRIAALENREG